MLAGILILNCKPQRTSQTNMIDQITYAHRGPSVAPQFHRSYVIIINAERAEVKITDYYTTLVQKTFELQPNQWNNLVRMSQSLREKGVKYTQGATGTDYNALSLKMKEKTVHKFEWDGLQPTEMYTQNFVDEISKTIPGLQQLLDNTMK